VALGCCHGPQTRSVTKLTSTPAAANLVGDLLWLLEVMGMGGCGAAREGARAGWGHSNGLAC
jgi:hypothetical protein